MRSSRLLHRHLQLSKLPWRESNDDHAAITQFWCFGTSVIFLISNYCHKIMSQLWIYAFEFLFHLDWIVDVYTIYCLTNREGEFFHTFAIVLAHLALIMRVNGRGFEFAPLIISVFYVLGHHNNNGTILNPATTLAFGCTGLLQSCLFPAKLEDQSWLASFRTTAPQTQAACSEAPTIMFNTFAYMLAQMVAASCAVVVFLMLERSGMAMQRAKRARRQGIARSQRSLYKIKLVSERGWWSD